MLIILQSTLSYSCICEILGAPDLSKYVDTIPFFICTTCLADCQLVGTKDCNQSYVCGNTIAVPGIVTNSMAIASKTSPIIDALSMSTSYFLSLSTSAIFPQVAAQNSISVTTNNNGFATRTVTLGEVSSLLLTPIFTSDLDISEAKSSTLTLTSHENFQSQVMH